MFKELRFDVVGAIVTTDKYDKEWEAIHQFNASEHKNMVLEYDTEREAKNAVGFLSRLVKTENLRLKFRLFRKTGILVTRTNNEQDGGNDCEHQD